MTTAMKTRPGLQSLEKFGIQPDIPTVDDADVHLTAEEEEKESWRYCDAFTHHISSSSYTTISSSKKREKGDQEG